MRPGLRVVELNRFELKRVLCPRGVKRMSVSFRPAVRADAREIARLFQISSEGCADYIWSQMAQPGQQLLDVGEMR